MELKKGIMNARVLLGMLVVQVIATGLQILSRVILSEGTFIFALMSYRNVVAAFAVAPFALYFERGALRKISFEAFLWLFMVALTGIEKLNVHTKAGKMKIAGAMLCFAGALTMALYKGESFNLSIYNQHKILVKTHQNNTRGTMLLIGSCLSYGCWFILQVELFKVFPHRYSGTMIICIIASVQATLVGLCVDRKPMSWRLGWNLQLLTIFYSGVLATAATFALISMAIIAKGPTYPSMFNPLSLIFILIIEAIFFAQDLYIGSLIGMVLIITGLYSFLWGRQKDMKAAPPQLCLKDIGGGEDVEKIMESGGLQSSAIIAPATSPINVTAIHKFDEIS
ncbi:WAT1-related protein At5g64700-like isoform X2 [Salvia miltiorrhiza]|uniref:WAT1-related protein At5g64700-like isoform X2 n=1 Tax=Salvia miltiorrhiza TaxID=226208 RepID=UPI0025AD6AE1|nr:WAT1-related protein At5g64700-like isoform X2 [Salvia miltiorrhiza]